MNEYQIKKAIQTLQSDSERNTAEHLIFNATIEEVRTMIIANEVTDRVIESKLNKMQLQLDRLFILLESIEENEEENEEEEKEEKNEKIEEILEELKEETEEIKNL